MKKNISSVTWSTNLDSFALHFSKSSLFLHFYIFVVLYSLVFLNIFHKILHILEVFLNIFSSIDFFTFNNMLCKIGLISHKHTDS